MGAKTIAARAEDLRVHAETRPKKPDQFDQLGFLQLRTEVGHEGVADVRCFREWRCDPGMQLDAHEALSAGQTGAQGGDDALILKHRVCQEIGGDGAVRADDGLQVREMTHAIDIIWHAHDGLLPVEVFLRVDQNRAQWPADGRGNPRHSCIGKQGLDICQTSHSVRIRDGAPVKGCILVAQASSVRRRQPWWGAASGLNRTPARARPPPTPIGVPSARQQAAPSSVPSG